MENSQPKSIYRNAAEAGPVVALPLVVVAVSILLVNKLPGMSFLALPALIVVPFLLYRLMGRLSSRYPQYSSYWPLWLFGIYSFIFATLICALLAAVYLVFVEPAFISTYFHNALDALESLSAEPASPDFSAQAEVIRSAIDRRMLPSSMELVASMSWLCAFGGAVLSAALARLYVTVRSRHKGYASQVQ